MKPRNIPVVYENFSDTKVVFYKQQYNPMNQNTESPTNKIGGPMVQTKLNLSELVRGIFIEKELTNDYPEDIQFQKFYIKNITNIPYYNIRLMIDDSRTPHKYQVQFENKNVDSTYIPQEHIQPTQNIAVPFTTASTINTQRLIGQTAQESFLDPDEYVAFWLKKRVTKNDLENQLVIEPIGITLIMEADQATEGLTTYLYYGSAPTTVITEDLIKSFNKQYITSKEQTFVIDGNGGYLYFAYPKEFGTQNIAVNGLLNNAFEISEIDITDIFGNTKTYYVYKSMTLQHGTGIHIQLM